MQVKTYIRATGERSLPFHTRSPGSSFAHVITPIRRNDMRFVRVTDNVC